MYEQYYGLSERPFSLTPDPRFVFLSQRHRDALAHLLYGVGRGGSGGFVQLTGEVGTGKTTLCRLALEQVPENTRVALILNPMLNPAELLRAICTELEVDVDDTGGSLQLLIDRLNAFLLERHAAGERVVVMIDEAQNMQRDSLEQVRLLTNLETATDKLLQIILLGQPELRQVLAQPDLRQLAQRITARYHLDPLDRIETEQYVRHRLQVAGAPRCPFAADGLAELFRVSEGVPRLINIIADRAMLGGYAREQDRIGAALVRDAAREVAGEEYDEGSGWLPSMVAAAAATLVIAGGAALAWLIIEAGGGESEAGVRPAWQGALSESSAESAWTEIAALWPGISADQVSSACAGNDSAELSCQRYRGSWGYIERLGVPAVLPLTEPRGAYLVISGLARDEVLIRHQGQNLRMPVRQVDRRWLGEFLVIWPDDGSLLRPGDRGESVTRLKDLATRDPDQPWAGSLDDQFDPEFREWVEQFQQLNGLTVDGLIGPSTRLFMKLPHQDGPGLIIDRNGD